MSLGKILCLHGFVQNGPLFARKSSGVRKALKKIGYETVYLTAPVQVGIADLPFDVNVSSLGGDQSAAESMRSWWPNSESAPDYYKLDQAFEAVKESIEKDGPFVGVLGFSQGAGLAGVLCQMIEKLHPAQDPLKFGIFYSGFRLRPEEHQHYYTPLISTPTLHIVGSLDTVVSEERVMKLYNACEEDQRTLLMHPGGHFVPNGKDMVNKMIHWVQNGSAPATPDQQSQAQSQASSAATTATTTAATTPKTDNGWDEFDVIGKA